MDYFKESFIKGKNIMEANQKTQRHLHISLVTVSYEALNPGSALEVVRKVI